MCCDDDDIESLAQYSLPRGEESFMVAPLDVFAIQNEKPQWLGSSETFEKALQLMRETGPGPYVIYSPETGHKNFYLMSSDGLVSPLPGQTQNPTLNCPFMRKRVITAPRETIRVRGRGGLDVERAAIVEVTSEDKDFPVESAFVSGDSRGWRAAAPGSQTIRLIFDQPQRLKCISLVFEENETVRTQEFVLQWSPDGGFSFKEIVRQQWNFSAPESTREIEEYQVDLSNVTMLELVIKPNISGGLARASLKNLRLS